MDGANDSIVRVANIKINANEAVVLFDKLSGYYTGKNKYPTPEGIVEAGGEIVAAKSFLYSSVKHNCDDRSAMDVAVYVCLTHDVPNLGINAGYTHYDNEMLDIVTRLPGEGANTWHSFISSGFALTDFIYSYSDGHLLIADKIGNKK